MATIEKKKVRYGGTETEVMVDKCHTRDIWARYIVYVRSRVSVITGQIVKGHGRTEEEALSQAFTQRYYKNGPSTS